jgi:hypothetical protein
VIGPLDEAIDQGDEDCFPGFPEFDQQFYQP